MQEVDPKEYEKYARNYGITDYRQLLSRFEESGDASVSFNITEANTSHTKVCIGSWNDIYRPVWRTVTLPGCIQKIYQVFV